MSFYRVNHSFSEGETALGVRFQERTEWPSATRFFAQALPMIPNPKTAMFMANSFAPVLKETTTRFDVRQKRPSESRAG
jgi:hypothetical protein